LTTGHTSTTTSTYHILVTNDDGVQSPGILALRQALDEVARVTVLAPDHNWSAAGHNKTMHKPLWVNHTQMADGFKAMTSSGSPSDCVGLAVLGLVEPLPDLVVSGINQGPNMGHDITYSGTVAAAMEATVWDIPAIAVSLDSFDPTADYEAAAHFAAKLARKVLSERLPSNTFLNVNVPARPEAEISGVQLTRLGKRLYRDALVSRKDPRGRDYYWVGGEPPSGLIEDGTDIGAVANGYISVTPISMDMTDYRLLHHLESWHSDLNGTIDE
jgi:5'-nucleotidase